MPVFRFDKALSIGRGAKAFLNPEGGATASDTERREGGVGDREEVLPPTSEQRLKIEIESKKQELRRIRQKHRATKDKVEHIDLKRRKKTIQQETFELEIENRAVKGRAEDKELGIGALPDFVVIGAQKGGTTYLYQLLTQHPLIERAASKELHFFNDLFDEGVEWYRRCFPRPRLKDGRTTITGEATPSYLSHPHAAKRMAEVIPHARLIALLRNPVDRAYSHYQMAVRRGFEHLNFEEAIEAEEARLRSEREEVLEDEHHVSFNLERFSYLSRGVYVDQLVRLSEFFDREQMLVLKSEDFFERPQDTFKFVLNFLDLPNWELETWRRDKKSKYEQKMDPSTRRRLEEYFAPHNRRLYDFLGVDFGW
jgi:sulfotransferase family protein